MPRAKKEFIQYNNFTIILHLYTSRSRAASCTYPQWRTFLHPHRIKSQTLRLFTAGLTLRSFPLYVMPFFSPEKSHKQASLSRAWPHVCFSKLLPIIRAKLILRNDFISRERDEQVISSLHIFFLNRKDASSVCTDWIYALVDDWYKD